MGAEMFRHALMNFGDKFTKAEVDDIFGEFEVDDDGFIESKAVIGLFVAGGGEEKKEEEPAKEEAAPAEAPAEEEEGRQVNLYIAHFDPLELTHLLYFLYTSKKVFMLRRLSLYLKAQIFPYAMI